MRFIPGEFQFLSRFQNGKGKIILLYEGDVLRCVFFFTHAPFALLTFHPISINTPIAHSPQLTAHRPSLTEEIFPENRRLLIN